ncbi:hypothetical protein P12x_001843 [Tundrisphaera lichenicola]
MTEQEMMGLAIEKAREGIASGQTRFGAFLDQAGRVIDLTRKTVW